MKQTKPCRVLMLLTNAFDPDPRVYQEATALVHAGYDVTLICWDRDLNSPVHEVVEGIRVERIHVKSTHGRGSAQLFFLFLFWVKAYALALGQDLHIVHCHDFDTLPLGYLLAKQKRVPLVYDAHESYADMVAMLPTWLKRFVYILENVLLRRSDLLITVGEFLREALVRRGAKNSCVIGNWKRLQDFQFPEAVIAGRRKELGIPDGKLVVSFISHLNRDRRVDELLEAAKGNKDTYFLIGGYGALAGRVAEQAERSENIIYLGFVNPRYIPLYTCLSDAVLYGFDPNSPNAKYSAPNKLFEALAAGKAIVTGDFGEIGKIVKHEECGIVLSDYSPKTWGCAFDQLSLNSHLRKYQTNALSAARRTYNWKNAEAVLLAEYSRFCQSVKRT